MSNRNGLFRIVIIIIIIIWIIPTTTTTGSCCVIPCPQRCERRCRWQQQQQRRQASLVNITHSRGAERVRSNHHRGLLRRQRWRRRRRHGGAGRTVVVASIAVVVVAAIVVVVVVVVIIHSNNLMMMLTGPAQSGCNVFESVDKRQKVLASCHSSRDGYTGWWSTNDNTRGPNRRSFLCDMACSFARNGSLGSFPKQNAKFRIVIVL